MMRAFLEINLGNDLLSHDLNTTVSSAMEGLTAGFGMGPGVPPPLWLPRNLSNQFCLSSDGVKISFPLVIISLYTPARKNRFCLATGTKLN